MASTAAEHEEIITLLTLQYPTRPPSGNCSRAGAAWHITAEDEVCKVTRGYEEEFATLEGALLRRGGVSFMQQLLKLAQEVHP